LVTLCSSRAGTFTKDPGVIGQIRSPICTSPLPLRK
jgi:hypothetical protein